MKDIWESSFTPSIIEEYHWQEGTLYEPESRFSPDTESEGVFILDFLDSRTVSNKFLFYKLPSLWYFNIVAWMD